MFSHKETEELSVGGLVAVLAEIRDELRGLRVELARSSEGAAFRSLYGDTAQDGSSVGWVDDEATALEEAREEAHQRATRGE